MGNGILSFSTSLKTSIEHAVAMNRQKVISYYNPQYPFETIKWTYLELIGQGAFSTVYRVEEQTAYDHNEEKKHGKQRWIVRECPLKHFRTVSRSISFIRYLALLKKNPRRSLIPRYIFIGPSRKKPKELDKGMGCSAETMIYFLFDDNHYIPLSSFSATEDQKKLVVWNFLDAVTELHSHLNTAHCDIKPPNILVDPKTCDVYLIDFDLCKIGTRLFEKIVGGTPRYIPLENSFDEKNETIDLFKRDAWAVGITIVEFLDPFGDGKEIIPYKGISQKTYYLRLQNFSYFFSPFEAKLQDSIFLPIIQELLCSVEKRLPLV